MKTLFALGALGALASAAALLACAASDDALVSPDEGAVVPGLDATADANGDARDGDAGSEECLADALCPVGPFQPGAPGGALDLRTRINRIRGRGPHDVWAVGALGASAHFDGTRWSTSDTGATETFTGLWFRDAGTVAFASLSSAYARGADLEPGDGGVPSADGWLRTEPQFPSEFLGGTQIVTSTWGTPGAEWMWGTILGDQYTEVRSLGSGVFVPNPFYGLFRARVAPGTRTIEVAAVVPPKACRILGCVVMTSIHGSSPDDLWAVGLKGAAFRVTHAQSDSPELVPFNTQTWAMLEGVWVASATDAWAVGAAGTIRHYTGGSFTWDVVDDVPATENLHAVWGTSSSDVWVVGDDATILHYDGKTWSRVPVMGLGARRPDLFAVWTSAPGRVWVGGDGVILALGGKP